MVIRVIDSDRPATRLQGRRSGKWHDSSVLLASSSTSHSVFGAVFTVGLIVAFFAQVMRAPIRIERQLMEGNPPKQLTLRGMRPARSRQWWWATWVVKTPDGYAKGHFGSEGGLSPKNPGWVCIDLGE